QDSSSSSNHAGSLPLSWFERLLLPRVWTFSHSLAELDLPDDPAELLAELVTTSDGAAQDATDSIIHQSDLVELAIQTWRLQRRVDAIDPAEHKREHKQFTDSVRRFVKLLERFHVEFEDPTGRPYTAGWLEVDVVSWDDPGADLPPVESGPW